jgi:predicted nucleic acid-binding protein
MTGMLVDTDILVYAYLAGPPDERAKRAKETVAGAIRSGSGFLSAQNLAEFSRFHLRRASPSVPPGVLRDIVADLEASFTVLRPSGRTVKDALAAVERHRLPFWDAMLWAVAKENGVDEVLTEDLPPSPVIEGVRYRNPLA